MSSLYLDTISTDLRRIHYVSDNGVSFELIANSNGTVTLSRINDEIPLANDFKLSDFSGRIQYKALPELEFNLKENVIYLDEGQFIYNSDNHQFTIFLGGSQIEFILDSGNKPEGLFSKLFNICDSLVIYVTAFAFLVFSGCLIQQTLFK